MKMVGDLRGLVEKSLDTAPLRFWCTDKTLRRYLAVSRGGMEVQTALDGLTCELRDRPFFRLRCQT